MIYVLIANNKIKMINTSQVKINEKICEIKKNNPKTIFITKSFNKMDFENSFNGSRIILRDYIEKCLVIKEAEKV
jgi:hypothetical protein